MRSTVDTSPGHKLYPAVLSASGARGRTGSDTLWASRVSVKILRSIFNLFSDGSIFILLLFKEERYFNLIRTENSRLQRD